MPGMNGGETFDRIKAVDSNLKVILSSGYSLNGQATDILKRGCQGFIQKPFNIQELSQSIRKALGRLNFSFLIGPVYLFRPLPKSDPSTPRIIWRPI